MELPVAVRAGPSVAGEPGQGTSLTAPSSRRDLEMQHTNPPVRKYRFGFILSTTIGNRTHYLNLRRFTEVDQEVESWWVTADHGAEAISTPVLNYLPNAIRMRMSIIRQLLPSFKMLRRTDVVMVHQFEAELLYAARSYLCRTPRLVSSTDEAPAGKSDRYPMYPGQKERSAARSSFRLTIDRWRARRFDRLIPFTSWAAGLYRKNAAVPESKIKDIHVGLDLELWSEHKPKEPFENRRKRILFVGSDFHRKGGDLLLRVFKESFEVTSELHLVTRHVIAGAGPNVFFHGGIPPNDERLVNLYTACDVVVLPTTADLAPWALIEGMAMSCPVIATDVGAIAELIDHGVTGYVIPVADADALRQTLTTVLNDEGLAKEMGRQGRLKVEREYDASRNVPRILAVMKAMADLSNRRP